LNKFEHDDYSVMHRRNRCGILLVTLIESIAQAPGISRFHLIALMARIVVLYCYLGSGIRNCVTATFCRALSSLCRPGSPSSRIHFKFLDSLWPVLHFYTRGGKKSAKFHTIQVVPSIVPGLRR